MNTRLAWVFTLCLAASAPLLAADDPRQLFDSLYGKELARVRLTQDPADDIALAGDMVQAATASDASTPMLALLCDTAYTLASKDPRGYEIAVAALRLWKKADPAQNLAAATRISDLLQKGYSAAHGDEKKTVGPRYLAALTDLADAQAASGALTEALLTCRRAMGVAGALHEKTADIQSRLELYTEHQRSMAKIDALHKKLQADKTDHAAAKDLILAYAVELDNPAEARKYTFLADDAKLAELLRLASSDPASLEAEQCMELAEWYRDLAEGAPTPPSKLAMLQHAHDHYARFLELHPDTDLTRTKATLALAKVDQSLGKKAGDAPDAAGWIDALKLVEVEKHRLAGEWARKDEMVACPSSVPNAVLKVPVNPVGDYEISAMVSRMENSGVIGVSFPVNGRMITYVVDGNMVNTTTGIGSAATGLEALGYNGFAANLTTVPGHALPLRTPTRVVIKVAHDDNPNIRAGEDEGRRFRITATIAGQNRLNWSGSTSQLAANPKYVPGNRSVNIVADNTRAVVQELKVRIIRGAAFSADPMKTKDDVTHYKLILKVPADGEDVENPDERREDPDRPERPEKPEKPAKPPPRGEPKK
jgi:hypothetical protein